MQKVKTDIKVNVMEKINKNEIVMKPRYYFLFGTLFSLVGLIASVITSIFLISVISFLLRQHGPMGEYRLNLMINSFPLWIPVLAVIGIVVGIIMLRKYDFSYKSNFWLILTAFLLAIILAGVFLDISGLNNIWLKRGPMKQIMKSYNLNNLNAEDKNGPGKGKGNGSFRFRNNLE